jgi:hypothetical protein
VFSGGGGPPPPPRTLTIIANDVTRLYGQPNPAFSPSFSGGDAADLTNGVSFRVLGPAVNVGTYVIEPFGAASASHTLAYVNGVLSVTPAPLTIRAASFSRNYGQANPAFGASYAGLVNGDTAAAVGGLTFTTPATVASGVGTYAIAPGGASAANYTITYANGVLTVTPAILTVTAGSASRLYGDANPTLSGTLQGLVNGDTAAVVSGLSYTTSATAASNVGTYAIGVGGGATSANYVLAYVDGVLTVTPAPLTISMNSAVMTSGGPLVGATFTYEGLRNGDPESIVSLTPEADSAAIFAGRVGVYPVVLKGELRGSANYTLNFVNGTLTILAKPVEAATTTTIADAEAWWAGAIADAQAKLDAEIARMQAEALEKAQAQYEQIQRDNLEGARKLTQAYIDELGKTAGGRKMADMLHQAYPDIYGTPTTTVVAEGIFAWAP